MRPHKRLLIALSILLYGSIGLQLVNPQILRYFIDTARQGGTLQTLSLAAALFIGIAVSQQLLQVVANYTSEKLAWLATNALREDLALHCLRLDMRFHNRTTPGELIERIDGDIANLANFFSQFAIRVVGNFFLLIGVLVVLSWEDWRLGVALGIYSIIALVTLFSLKDIAVPHWKKARQASADFYGFVEEHLGGCEDIKANGATQYALNGLFRFAGQRLHWERRAGVMNIWLRIAVRGFRVLGLSLALGAGYYLFKQDALSVGAIFMVVTYTNTLFRPLEHITSQLEDLQAASASIERLDELYHTPTGLADGEGPDLPDGPLEVVFDRVDFAYNADDPVLQDISFTLQPGQVLGLLGRTGSGKSTLGRLLFRLYDIDRGRIGLAGTDIGQLRLENLRQRVGMVSQTVQLFRGSLRDNLRFFNDRIPDEEIHRVIDLMGLDKWYRSLPYGLDTELDSGHKGLSAGEAQLLTFTRVFLQNPGLVILDEASSRLDPATQSLIERAVDGLLAERTGIIIAHRLATVQRADHILILEEGRTAEYGPRADLEQDPGSRFSALLKTGSEALA